MKRTTRTCSAVLVAVLALAVGLPAAQAAQSDADKRPCVEAVAKNGGKFIKKKLKRIQKCKNADLAEPGDCDMVDLAADLAALETKYAEGIAKKCAVPACCNTSQLEGAGYPGKCLDATPLDAFNSTDLQTCMVDAHEDIVDALIEDEYGSTVGPLADPELDCQKEIAKNGAKYANARLKAVQKCRNDINKGKIFGLAPRLCATNNLKASEAIAKADSKARAKIAQKCTSDAIVANLDVCDPPANTVLDVQNCIIQTHADAVDNLDNTEPADAADFEYATAPSCGDNILNGNVPLNIIEECDGTQDAACPGMCGAPTGDFGCLCLNKKRERVIEHSNADLDNGYTGISHDSGIVEGGGYVADLYDCDNVGDFDCIVGPNCTGLPTLPCTNDAACGIFGPCRKERTAVGPHCNLNIQVACTSDAQCPDSPGLNDNFCVKTPHGAPLPLSSGGVSVCVENIFSEDVVGTVNLATGDGAIRLRQNSSTRLGPTPPKPCPICGGFCGDPPGGTRKQCTTNADCTGVPCVTDFICDSGEKTDQECRPNPPFGGGTPLFGNPSQDCTATHLALLGTIDILFNPATTGTTSLLPSHQCDNFAGGGTPRCFGGGNDGNTCAPISLTSSACPGGACLRAQCLNGANDGAACTVNSQCPGGFCGPQPYAHMVCSVTDPINDPPTATTGRPCQVNGDCDPSETCKHQCFCPTQAAVGGNGITQKPNDCEDACVSTGADDMDPCSTDADCPTGFCHPADCRVNPLDPTNPEDGICTVGPIANTCSITTFRTCNVDADCQAPACQFCDPGNTETCESNLRQCFIGSGIVRTGVPGVPDGKSASTFCITGTSSSAVNATAGLPGPGALITPQTRVETGF